MSKTTKIIAALGVVAGLGVAALPAFTFAEGEPSVTGDVDVVVKVDPAIAMTIVGNNDNAEIYGTPNAYTAVGEPTGNPKALGYYEEGAQAGTYIPTGDTTVVSSKTYYQRTGSYRPVDTYNPTDISGNLDGHPIPGFPISGTSSSAWRMSPNSVKEGGDFKSTVTVYTNATGGYTLNVIDSNNDAALIQQDPGTATADRIEPIGTETPSTTTLTAGQGEWGFRLGTSGDWLAMPNSTEAAHVIASPSAKTHGGDTYTIEYGVATKADQANGVYIDNIVYTATTK